MSAHKIMKIKLGALTFRPMPWLTFFTLICVAILISLGTWQYKRLIWKTALMEQIDASAHSAPLTSLAVLSGVIKTGAPVNFRRIELNGSFIEPTVNDAQPFHLMRSDGKRYYWRLYQPYRDGGQIVFVATHDFDEAEKDTPPTALIGQKTVIGYVRMVQSANKFTPKSTPDKNRWFAFNALPETHNWSNAISGERIRTIYFIDQSMDATSAEHLPVRIPEVANNHLDYMLTWYSFVLILLVIYLLLHKKVGRLSVERK